MITLDSIVIVEGKYDKITLENFIDATIITTNGFGIYKDKDRRDLIKRLCKEKGVIVITDSDSAGAQIRSFIKSICNTERIVNVYLPQIPGKEKRKTKPSKQGYLGVEGMNMETILAALEKSGITGKPFEAKEKICKIDLYKFGLSGGENSKSFRVSFSEFAGIPKGISSNAFLDALNSIFTREDFLEEVSKWRQAQVKN